MADILIALIIALVITAVVYYAVKKILPSLGLPLPPATMTIIDVIFMVIVLLILLKYVPPLLRAVL